MSAYNLLRLAEVSCDQCGRVGDRRIQFIYGAWRAAEYTLDESLEWNGRPLDGVPGLLEVVVQGILECCPNCGFHPDTEYDIVIKGDVIVAAAPSSGRYTHENDTWMPLRLWE